MKDLKSKSRTNLRQNSEDFVAWVNKIGLERTWVGKLAHAIETRLQLRRFALIFLFAFALSFFIAWDFEVQVTGYRVGDLASSDIRSPLSFEVVDVEQTSRKKLEAEESIPPVYDYDPALYDQLSAKIHRAFRLMRRTHADLGGVAKKKTGLSTEWLSRLEDFEKELGGINIPKSAFEWMLKQGFRLPVETAIVQALERWSSQKIVEDLGSLRKTARERILVNILERGGVGEELLIETSTLLDISEVRRRIGTQGAFGAFGREADVASLGDLTRAFVVPNLTLNKLETETRRGAARDGIMPVIVSIKKGQVIIKEGAPIQSVHVSILDQLKRLQDSRHQDLVSLVMACFFVILLLCFSSYLARFTSRVVITRKDTIAMGSILLFVMALAKFSLFVCNAALVERFTSVPQSFYIYLIPMSAGAMMVGLIIPYGEVVWLFSTFLAIAGGLLVEKNFGFMIVTFTAGIVAARGVYGCKKRSDLYFAGLKTGLINAMLIVCVTFMSHSGTEALKSGLIWNTAAGFASGILASLIALTLIPLWESIFNYTTDVRLLELSSLNHPLMKEMIVRAPGTYHHSLVVGSMCEAAAEAIGANPLLAKVCAYYHDIGKMAYAGYFIENQKQGENPHDHINPTMSKTILVAHVKDGVELAHKYKLGQPIVDVIEQHHGTTLISFFYHRAKEHEDQTLGEIRETEYRYPGPRPQFREAALCMLADSIEAAARSLDEPTPARLQNIVHTIIQRKFLDGQLDECNITLKDLMGVEDAFGKILLGIYHQRIDYPTGPKQNGSRSAPHAVS